MAKTKKETNKLDLIKEKLKTCKYCTKQKMVFVGILILLVVILVIKGWVFVAFVNNQPIFRISLIKELEKQGGKRVLDSAISKALILQEARKQKIVVNQDEINAEIKKIEDQLTKQGQNLDTILAGQGLKRNELDDQIKMQIIIEKILGKDIVIIDKDVDDYLVTNKSFLPKDLKEEEQKALAKEQLKQQKVNAKVTEWLDSLRKAAKINYFVQY